MPAVPLILRPFVPADAAALVALKRETIRRVNCRDYAPDQIAAWLPRDEAAAAMPARLAGRFVVVAEADGVVVGFGDVGDDELIDQFFVAAHAQRQGVGRQIMTALLAEADRRDLPRIHSHVSLTARPFFERFGFAVEQTQIVVVRGVELPNFLMSRPFATPFAAHYNPAVNGNERKVHVNVQPQAYDVRIAPGLIDDCGPAVRAVTKSTRVGLVADANTSQLFAGRVTASLNAAGFDVVTATLPAGEAHKTLPSLMPVYDAFLSAKFERSTPVIALGGGVVGDMTGFVAATLLRGVPFIQMPTTLLSMVDASVGGKTGVDHAVGKNLIGVFHQPATVLIDPAVLQTLPPRELRSGLAECVKHMVIRDENGFANMEANLDDLLALKPQKLVDHIAANVKIKAKVVEADPFEKGERAHLNFGHTFGHAIETLSNYDYAHGEAISLGMCAAAFAARELKMIDEKTRQRLVALLARVGLPTTGLTLDVDAVVDAMWFDKKVKNGRIRFVLPEKIGSVIVRDDLSRDLLRAAVASLQ